MGKTKSFAIGCKVAYLSAKFSKRMIFSGSGVDFSAIKSTNTSAKWSFVVPMLYLQKKSPRKLFTCKGFRFVLVGATGFEPVTLCL